MTYLFLQQYWWFIVSLLGAILVFMLFVQGANSLMFSLGKTEDERRMIINSTGRKWELTFTTLVTFGGAFFASFPLFYSTSFGGAYWLWMIILFSFVVQAVGYEFQSKHGNILGTRTFRIFLVANGFAGPFFLGCAVATFFTGANFIVLKNNITDMAQPVISSWANGSHGLDALLNPWNVVLGLAVFFLARILGILYIMNNVRDENIRSRGSVRLIGCAAIFLVLFVAFLIRILFGGGYAVDPGTGTVSIEDMKIFHNLTGNIYLLVAFLIGLVMVLYAIVRTVVSKTFVRGIWPCGIGVVLVVLTLLLCAGWNATAYYPSTADMQYSLTIANSCSSEFTLRTMAYVSLLVPFVLGYIAYVWRAMDKGGIDKEDMKSDDLY